MDVPVDTNGPLPYKLTTLDFILPEERREQYVREMDGSFRLAWVYQSEYIARLANDLDLFTGPNAPRIVPDGSTPAAEDAKAESASRKVFDELASMEKRQAAQRHEKAMAELEKQKQKAELDYKRATGQLNPEEDPQFKGVTWIKP